MARKAFIEHGIGKPAKFFRKGLDFQGMIFKLSKLPFIGRRHPWVRPDMTDVRFVPINDNIQRPENTPLPITLVDRLIEEASHRMIVYNCGCRTGYECKTYPHDIGCLLMGDGALNIPRSVSREVSVEEAKVHAHKAFDAGLVPMVGLAHIDDFIYGVKHTGTMLTVCFCCECCCITRNLKSIPPKYLEPAYTRFEGIDVIVTERCTGCGKCAEHCFIEAIRMENKHAVIDRRICRACGRCATHCPQNAIDVRFIDPDFLEKTYRRIRSRVKFD